MMNCLPTQGDNQRMSFKLNLIKLKKTCSMISGLCFILSLASLGPEKLERTVWPLGGILARKYWDWVEFGVVYGDTNIG